MLKHLGQLIPSWQSPNTLIQLIMLCVREAYDFQRSVDAVEVALKGTVLAPVILLVPRTWGHAPPNMFFTK